MVSNSVQEKVSARVEEIIRLQTALNEIELTPETDLLIDLGIDSLELVEMGLKIEKEFGKKLPIVALRSCLTLGELTQLIHRVTSGE
jgi:acyl carrier protein